MQLLKHGLSLLLCLLLQVNGLVNAQKISVDNTFSPAADKGRYNWKVFLKGSPSELASVAAVEYTLHPTMSPSFRVVQASPRNPDCSLEANGWGEFQLKLKVIFRYGNMRPLYLVYPLDLHSDNRNTRIRTNTPEMQRQQIRR